MQRGISERIRKDEVIKIPRSVTTEIIRHKHYRAFLVYLQLKPLYISGVILSEEDRIPYEALAKYLGLSISGVRAKVKQLKKYKLIRCDRQKNFHLASYKQFVNLFRPQYLRRMKKYVYRNVAGGDMMAKTAAIQENFRKQEYVLKNKILNQEIYGTVTAHVDRLKQPEGFIPSSTPLPNDCRLGARRTDLSKTAIRKVRKVLMKDYDRLLHKHKKEFLVRMEQVEDGLPAINPYVTLSCMGLGRLFGVGGSAGHYQQTKLLEAGVIGVKPHYEYIDAHVPAVYENRMQIRSDVFSYIYPVKRGPTGRQEKFFMRLPNLMSINLNFVYENAKN